VGVSDFEFVGTYCPFPRILRLESLYPRILVNGMIHVVKYIMPLGVTQSR
jgi:hypothetical protein